MADDENKNNENEIHEEGLSDYEKGEQKKKKIMYIIIFAVQLVLAFVLIKFFIIPWYSDDQPENVEDEQIEQSSLKEKIGQIYTISDLTVNPKDSRGRRFAIFEIALSIPEDPAVTEEIKKYEVILRDKYIQYFRSKTIPELSVDTALVDIKSDLMNITNEFMGKKVVNDIFFTQFILQ
jgi:flagellar basal body-associated protein FliL